MLVYGMPGSDKPNVFGGEAKSLGLSVSTAMPNDVLQLLTLYPQPVRMQGGGGVEYLPVERRNTREEGLV